MVDGWVTDEWRERAMNLPPPRCDKCGGPESTLDFYREWGEDPMGISVFCDEHA